MQERPDLDGISKRNARRKRGDPAAQDIDVLLAWIECLEMQLRVAAEARLMVYIQSSRRN